MDVDENLFCMPKSKQIEKLEWIIGDWDVIVNAFSPRANRWYNIDTTTSEIEFEANNMITEEFSYTQVFVKDFVINYTYNSIENEYLVTIFDGFSANLGLFTGAFVDSTFVVTNKIAECDSITVPTDKFIYTNTGKNTFEINISNSFDGGKTWVETGKLIYTRKEDN